MTEADDSAHAAKTIDALVEALEKIEANGCYRVDRGPDPFSCTGKPAPCTACIAHEALVLFRGQ